MFADHSTEVDWETQIVRLATGLVDKALPTAPRPFVPGVRDARFDLSLDGRISYLSTDGFAIPGSHDLFQKHTRPNETHPPEPHPEEKLAE